MIVFLVGGESRLMDDLITKMEKEGHKTYLLTGKRDRRGKYRRVFERYDFPYDSESVQEIFSNVNPDLVLFLGAYDTNYDWSDARKESVRYTADLTNILSAYAFKQDGRFIYLSSEAVYGRSYSSDIHETEPASAKRKNRQKSVFLDDTGNAKDESDRSQQQNCFFHDLPG